MLDPQLRDGASISLSEKLLFIRRFNHKVYILNFLSNDRYGKYKFVNFTNNENETYKLFNDIKFYQRLLPYSFKYITEKYGEIVKIIMQELRKYKIEYALTIDNDVISLFSAYLLGIPGAHFFNALNNIKKIMNNPLVIKLLANRTVFANSEFINIKLKELLGVEAITWHSIINPHKYLVSKKVDRRKKIGFCSGGPLKGDEIVNRIVEKMPNTQFVIVGKNYYYQFKKFPKNLEYLGHLRDMKKFYSQIKVLLVPSIVEEAFPRVILEAAINGIPVIANKIGGIPEALGDSGILIDIELNTDINQDEIAERYIYQINRLLNDDNEYTTYSKKALSRAKEYLKEQNKISYLIYDNYIR